MPETVNHPLFPENDIDANNEFIPAPVQSLAEPVNPIGNAILFEGVRYVMTPANATSAETAVSLLNPLSGRYLRHFSGRVFECACVAGDSMFAIDSTFFPKHWNDGLILQCVNDTLPDHYICRGVGGLVVVSNNLRKCLPYVFVSIPVSEQGSVHAATIEPGTIIEELQKLKSLIKRSYAATLMRDASKKTVKYRRVVFIGTSRLGENGLYAYRRFREAAAERGDDADSMYYARTREEERAVTALGLPCEVWSDMPKQMMFATGAKVAVFSTHLFSGLDNGNAILSAACSGAKKMQLWHGMGVSSKKVGCSLLDGSEKSPLDTAKMLEDCCSVDVFATAFASPSALAACQEAFPAARIVYTGNARNDVLTAPVGDYPPFFQTWLEAAGRLPKVLFAPTFRDTAKDTRMLLGRLHRLVEKAHHAGVACIVKLHPMSIKYVETSGELSINPHALTIPNTTDIYTLFPAIDIMVSDYSSIRYEFAMTGKPVMLWRPDLVEYLARRPINPATEFVALDQLFYPLEEETLDANFKRAIADPEKESRIARAREIGLFADGQASERTVRQIFELLDE